MKPASAFAVVAAILSCSAALGNPVWTETFDTGVGRFNQTNAQADANFVWNTSTQAIDGRFWREQGDPLLDTDVRAASLTHSLTQADVFGFSVEWTPLQQSSGEVNPSPLLGFFAPNGVTMPLRVRVWQNSSGRRNYKVSVDGTLSELATATIPDWDWGQTYLMEFLYDGVAETVSLSQSIWSSGEFIQQGVASWPSTPLVPFVVTSLGMSNLVTSDMTGPPKYTDLTLDNFSFTPEPSTAMLLTAASLFAFRRRRQAA